MSDKAPKLLGVLGHPIGHSQSPSLFRRILAAEGREDVVYRTFDLPNMEDFHTLTLDHPNLVGLNVTVPHKQAVLSKLVRVSEEARAVGAVNTLVKTPQGWEGHNTDVWGFQRSIQPFLSNRHERALVLGTGGSAAAVHHVLAKLGIEAVCVSRTGDSTKGTRALGRTSIGYHEVTEWVVRHHLLVVHCTPVGMHPHDDDMVPFPTSWLTSDHLVVDLIYSPAETRLLRESRAQGAAVLNGADMLRLQAEKAWEIWKTSGV